MPPKVATPQQAAAAQAAAATMTDVRNPNATGSGNRFQRTRPLTKFERDALRVPVPCVYVYNISPIFKWAKDYPGLGPMTLMPRKEDERVSAADRSACRLVRRLRWRKRNPPTHGRESARHRAGFPLLLAGFPRAPGKQSHALRLLLHRRNSPLEMPKEEQEKILDAAELEHRNRLHEKVGEADALQNTQFRVCITEVNRKAALYLHRTGDIQELPDWVQRRSKLNTTEECRFCGFENRRGIVKCRNCHEVLDQEAYDALKKNRQEERLNEMGEQFDVRRGA